MPKGEKFGRKMPMQFDTCHGTTFLTLDDVKVPAQNLIGQEGGGWVSASVTEG